MNINFSNICLLHIVHHIYLFIIGKDTFVKEIQEEKLNLNPIYEPEAYCQEINLYNQPRIINSDEFKWIVYGDCKNDSIDHNKVVKLFEIDNDKWNIPKGGIIDIITDHRFPNELTDRVYMNGFQKAEEVVTLRLHRKDVLVAPKEDNPEEDSEHAMDYYLTKYLLIPPGET